MSKKYEEKIAEFKINHPDLDYSTYSATLINCFSGLIFKMETEDELLELSLAIGDNQHSGLDKDFKDIRKHAYPFYSYFCEYGTTKRYTLIMGQIKQRLDQIREKYQKEPLSATAVEIYKVHRRRGPHLRKPKHLRENNLPSPGC